MADQRGGKLVITFVLFLFLLNFPILSIVDKRELIAGFPKLYFYLFFIWFSLIIAIVFIVLRQHK
jgi:hypothetical protein